MLDVVRRIEQNFWLMNDENNVYKALYMLFDAFSQLKPRIFYELPKIEKILKEVSLNQSTYHRWHEGKGVNFF